jgi:hypothetical protein
MHGQPQIILKQLEANWEETQQSKDNTLVREGEKLIVHRHRESPVFALASLR